jgi:hypothetical protein
MKAEVKKEQKKMKNIALRHPLYEDIQKKGGEKTA